MLKTIKKLLSAILSVSVLTVSAAVFASADAQTAEFNPQDKLIMLSSCSNFTGNYSTSNVPDGAGMKITINSATSNSNNITGSYLENSISLTKEQLSKGAFIIYSGHDESRTLSDGTEETAYADNLFMFRFNNGSNVDLKIDGASGGKPVYFISSATGTVIRNDTNNSSTKLAVDSDGNYYNEGYWVIPGASLQLSTLTDGVSYPFTLLKCNPRNIKDTDNINNYLSATCNYYYDNLAFVENIEDILGTAADGVYEYDAGDTYPVYKLGYMTGKTEAAPEITCAAGSITISGLSGDTKINLYRYGKFYGSTQTSAAECTVTGLETGSYTLQTVKVGEDGKYANASEIASKAIIDASKLQMLRDYSELTPYDETTGKGNGVSCVPDGAGFFTSTSNKTYNDFTHTTDLKIEMNAELAQNGAIIFYFKHDAQRTVDDVTETAYSDVVPNLIFRKEGDTNNNILSVKASTSSRQPIYFISSVDGTVIRNETYNSSTQLAKLSDGTYYNEGYWVVPMSAFTNQATDGTYEYNAEEMSGYSLTMLKCTYRNIKSLSESDTVVPATCNYYFDNFAYVENIEDILGPIVSGTKGTDSAVYTYDAGSSYPVYTLGGLDTDASELDKASGQLTRTKDGVKIQRGAELEGKAWSVNIYDGGKLIYSKDMSAAESEFTLELDNSAIVRAQIIADGAATSAITDVNRAGDIREDKNINILDLVAMKKLSANSSGKYNSDIDGNGLTNGRDIILLRKMLLGYEIK